MANRVITSALILTILAACTSVTLAEETEQEIEARRDYFRISGEVEFDGQQVSYDEVVQVRTDVGIISTMGLKKGDNRIYMSRLWVTRLLKDGSALVMEIPAAWGLFGDLERPDNRPDPSWTPEYIQDNMRPPPVILPEFYWADRAANPSFVEAYVSEAYYARPDARLKILKPITIDFVQSSLEAEAKALAQAESEPPLPLGEDGRVDWVAPMALAIEKRDWSRIGDVSAAVVTQPETDFALQKPLPSTLRDYAGRELRWELNPTSTAYGVPQPNRLPDGEGVLYYRSIGRYAANTIPLRCDAGFRVCMLSLNERGLIVFYKHKISQVNYSVTLGSVTVSGRSGLRAIYASKDEMIYLISLTSM